MKDYYAILDISSEATQADISEQYKFLLHAWHPDKFPGVTQKAKAEERTKEIVEAYSVLKDPSKRFLYDYQLKNKSFAYPDINNEKNKESVVNNWQQKGPISTDYYGYKSKNGYSKESKGKATENSKKKPNWNILVIVFLVVSGLFYSKYEQNKDSSQRESIVNNILPTEDPYKDCISWQATESHEGEYVCVIGKVIYVEKEYDAPSQQNVWYAHFSKAKNTFRLISVGSSLESTENTCLYIRGTLSDHSDLEEEYSVKLGPSMFRMDDRSNYTIKILPEEYCN